MRITVLCENTARDPALLAEHGLSLLLETQGHRILFDMGQTDAFSKNAERLGVCLADVDLAILSHGHYDHGGGIRRFLELNSRAPLYLSGLAFGEHYHGSERYIGLDQSLRESPRLCRVCKDRSIFPGGTILTAGVGEEIHPIPSAGLTVKQNGVFCPECFLHEQYLLVEEAGRRILISGCSHRGVRNLLDRFSPDVFVGGLHLSGLDPTDAADAKALAEVGADMSRSGARFWAGHCTGEKAYRALKSLLGDRLSYLSTGDCIEI